MGQFPDKSEKSNYDGIFSSDRSIDEFFGDDENVLTLLAQ